MRPNKPQEVKVSPFIAKVARDKAAVKEFVNGEITIQQLKEYGVKIQKLLPDS